ncbi:MAG TPA: bifunctional diaminohydroxyphosphoribosylaminopyrimidine deaminase/5-amino-6-(5-phosphoribosylamino)uracil reductase RibD [Burkholderiales bacterium]|nr:bifunctional diaminohydroxyphosphoribosylaminopyrimidine deaminase/5-amino-6-(5-phosphoribosylamino)uracil reductase RibD [Burkholderiales bacterium]
MAFSADDFQFMARALRLAGHGLYTTTPNPRVGCVLVKDSRIVGEGWHEHAGGPHAEVVALTAAAAGARGATAYVSLEPCSHQGRTPPCVDALIAAGVSRVVAAMEDPNPKVAGGGLRKLHEAGIRTESGILETEARELNIGFVSRMTRGRPWLRVKIAASLDGRTALRNKTSQWITGADARRDGHHWRARSCAVMTGIGTLADDDPRLTVRDVETPRQPLRIVVDSRLRITPEARILDDGGVLVATAVRDEDRSRALAKKGAEVVVLPNAEHKVDLLELAKNLGARGINEVLVEAGVNLNSALLRAGVVDELLIYLAPHMLGDAARGMLDLGELTEMNQRMQLNVQETRMIGPDLRILARPVAPVPGA